MIQFPIVAENEIDEREGGGQKEIIIKTILIDCGKTFREGAIRWFPHFDIRSVDFVVLTHGHADALFGIDDLRSTRDKEDKAPIPCYQSKECELVTRGIFPYLYPRQRIEGEEVRFVANIDWREITPFILFEPVPGLAIYPLPVEHGTVRFTFI